VLDLPKSFAAQLMKERGAYKGPSLITALPYISLPEDGIIMLRDGDLMASFTVEGINSDTADERETVELSKAFARFVAQQGKEISIYVHRISQETQPSARPVSGNPFAELIDKRWQSYLNRAGLRERTNMVTLIMKPAKNISKYMGMFDDSGQYARADRAARMLRLDQMVKTCMTAISAAKPRRLLASEGQWLSLLRTLIDGSRGMLKPGVTFTPLSDLLCNSDVRFKGNIFYCENADPSKNRYGTVITLKDYPTETYPGILDRLNLPFDSVVTQSFTPIDNLTAQNKISRVRKQMRAAEDAAVSLMAQLESAEDDVASGRTVFGEHHCAITLFCENEQELSDGVTFVVRAIQEAGASMVRESFAARTAYFSQHPGNFKFRTRPSMISSSNFSEFCAMHGQTKGNQSDKSPWGEAITVMPTGRGESFRFNFHLAGKHDARMVGHTLILGQTGSGKTLGTAFLLTQAQRVNPRIIIFDKDNGFEMAVRALGGTYNSVRMGAQTGFNPMRAESDARGVGWLTDWINALCNLDGKPLTPLQIQALTDAVQGNSHADPRLQNFEQFRSQLRATDDDGDLYTRMGRWDAEGQFGWLFGGKGEDTLSLNAKINAFDLTEIFENDIIRTAWLSFVFRRIERMVEDEYPTLLVLDEAWRLLDDPYFQSRLKDWMLTMRKKNVAVVLLTQRVSHITKSAAGDAILESAVTRLVYPSSYNTQAELAPLNLTTGESEFLQMSNVDNHLVLLKSGMDSVVLDFALGSLGKGLDILGGGRGEKFRPGWRTDPNFPMGYL
jgi:type IV secretion system protein VirB4